MSHAFLNRFRGGPAFFCAAWLLVAPLNAQEASRQSRDEQGQVILTSSVDRAVAHIADPIEWRLQVEAPAGSRVGWPVFPEQIETWEIRASDRRDDIPLAADKGRGKRRWTRTFLVETLKTGEQTLPAAEVRVDVPHPEELGEWQSTTLRTEPLLISIESSLKADADPSQFRDIKDVVEVEPLSGPSTSWMNWMIGGGLLVGLAALIAAFYWFGRRNRLPTVWARKELARLREVPVGSAAARQQRYAEIVDVVRQFLAAQFDPEIASQTAEEWSEYADANQLFDIESRSDVADLLKQHDMSRFARTGIEAQQLDEAFAVAARIIESAPTPGSESSSDAAIRDAVRMRSSA